MLASGEARLPMAPHLPWAGTLTEKGLAPSEKLEPSFCFSKASDRAAYQVAADVATRDRGAHVEKNVEPVAAVHMVALGCAHTTKAWGAAAPAAAASHASTMPRHRLALNYG